MSEYVTLAIKDGIGVIAIDNPPVNALNRGVLEGLESSLDRAIAEPVVRGIVVIGAGRTFVAGADINELASGSEGPNLHSLLLKIEDSEKPVVFAIHGTALGGGLEIAMAGHYRVATPDAQIGQPEVNLGIIPGAEGTQRLARLAGIARAVEMCVSGAPVKSPDALRDGIIDRIIEGDLLAGAIAFALDVVVRGGARRKTREKNEKLGSASDNEPIFQTGRNQAGKIRRSQIAPLKAIEAIQAAATLPFEDGCKKERALFSECIASDQAKAMIHAFFAEREVAKIPGISRDTLPYPIARAAIVGAGTMGGGIAMAFANAGISVLLKDGDAAALDRGVAAIRKNYENSVKKGRLTPDQTEQRFAMIHPQLTYEGFDRADMVIEAVFESMSLKKQIFAELDKIASPSCVLASNTSTLNLDEIADATMRASVVVGLHFFSPANVMRLVEIVRGRETSNKVIATALALTKKLRKVGVVVGNGRAFVGNRIMFPYMREAQFLVEEGATPEQVDRALFDWGMAMGIFAVDDMAGIDVAWRVKQEYRHLQKPGVRVPLVLDRLYEMGRLGQKTGRGWYRYDEDRRAISDPEVNALIEETAGQAGIERRIIETDEIIERCIYAMINEGARVLEDRIAVRAGDIDVIYLTGYGFPVYRGGPMWYADTIGLDKVYQRIVEYHRRFGEIWEPSPLLKHLAAAHKTFASLDREAVKSSHAS